MGNSEYLFGFCKYFDNLLVKDGELLQSKPIVKYFEINVRFKNCNVSFLI